MHRGPALLALSVKQAGEPQLHFGVLAAWMYNIAQSEAGDPTYARH